MRPFDRHKKRDNLGMSIYCEVLLDMVSRNKGITVMQLIKQAEDHNVAKQATLHKSVKWLTDNEFIKVHKGDGDSRMRNCSVAQRGTLFLKSFD